MKQQEAIEDPLRVGRDAASRHAWQEAVDALTAARASGTPLSAVDLEDLAQAAWWTGSLQECIEAREQAYAAHLESGDRNKAALVALQLAKDYGTKLSQSIAAGWFSRGERLLQQEGESIEHGYLARAHANVALNKGEFDRAIEQASRALEIATRFGDRDLQALSLHDQGRALAAKGQVDEGLTLMDEATVAAVGGELSPYPTSVIYCNTIVTCTEIADYRRAGEWTEAAKRWCERQSIAGFPGVCRVHRAEIMRLRGAWTEAEQEAVRACVELQGSGLLVFAGEGFYEVGEIRLRMGDFEGAERAFCQAHELGRDPQPGMSALLLARGDVRGARSSIKGVLDDDSAPRLRRARQLPVRVDVALAAGDLDDARKATEELEAIADEYGSPAIMAAARSALGSVLTREGRLSEAVGTLRRALSLWQDVDAPYEAAKTRMLLAEALRQQADVTAATLELQAAKSAFDRLGAAPDVRRALELLDGQAARRSTPHEASRAIRTFMFTDIVKSTNLIEAIGDDAWDDLVSWHDKTLRALFAAGGGEEIDHAGDGFFVAFEDATRAIDCAVAIQRTLVDHRRTHGFAPQVRTGLHTTEANSADGRFRGRGVHEAARVGALADGGEIVVSEATLRAANGEFSTSEPRPATLKGIAEPVTVMTVNWR